MVVCMSPEPGLINIIKETLGKYLFFSTDLKLFFEGIDAVFLCLPTPPNLDGSTNLIFYDAAIEEIAVIAAARKNKRRVVFVNKSTVPLGTVRHLEEVMNSHNVPNFGVASNPEFLAEGTVVSQAQKPDRGILGCGSRDCILDLTGITFVDSSGIVFFLKIQRYLTSIDKMCVLYGLKDNVQQMFNITKLIRLLKITRNIESAEKILKNN